MKIIARIMGVLLATVLALGQGQYSGPVLLVNPDARVVGTGGAGVALADDIAALYLNPAGLAFQENGEFAAHYSRLLPTLYDQFDYLSVAWKGPVGYPGIFGVSLSHYSLGGGDIMNSEGELLGSYHSSETVLSVSHGRLFSERHGLAGGINAKLLQSNLASGTFDPDVIGSGSALAWMLDLALLWRMPEQSVLAPMSFGLTLANVGTRLDYTDGDQRDPLPLALRLGLAFDPAPIGDHDLGFMLDIERIMTDIEPGEDADWALAGLFRSFGSPRLIQLLNMRIGAEYAFRHQFFGRVGINVKPLTERNSFTLGCGVLLNNLKIDIADELGDLNNSLRFTVAYLL